MNDARNHLASILDERPTFFALFMEHLPGTAWIIKDIATLKGNGKVTK